MIEIERKIKILTISTALVLAVLAGIAVMAYANGATNNTNTSTNVACDYGDPYYGDGTRAFLGRRGIGCERGWAFNVSEEFKNNVISIAENDSDVQKLLTEGYSVDGVRPIINATVKADGNVAIKATSAIVMMSQNTTGRARVWVDVEQAKVTRIEILTMTVIEK